LFFTVIGNDGNLILKLRHGQGFLVLRVSTEKGVGVLWGESSPPPFQNFNLNLPERALTGETDGIIVAIIARLDRPFGSFGENLRQFRPTDPFHKTRRLH
jgi:hypothetical protein